MSVTDHDRRALFDRLLAVLGPTEAETMMELLPPVGWSDVARRGDLALLRGEMAELRADLREEMSELRAELRGEVGDVRGEISVLRGEIAEVRGEVAELRAEVRGLTPRLIAANLTMTVGLAGVLLTAGALG